MNTTPGRIGKDGYHRRSFGRLEIKEEVGGGDDKPATPRRGGRLIEAC